eukprot:gene18483-biopygen15572
MGKQEKKRCPFCLQDHEAEACESKAVECEQLLCNATQGVSTTRLDAEATAWVGSTGLVSPSSVERVALQTVLESVEGRERSRVRVMYDSGSQKLFVFAKAVNSLNIEPLSEESLGIRTFGQSEADVKVREVYELGLRPLKDKDKSVIIQAFVVAEISSISNFHVEELKKNYNQISNVYFSDVSRTEDVLEIDVLIGADYMWSFQEGRQIRGGQNEPVAIKKTLGWVVSGPIKDSVGIRVDDEVHENVIDDITFNGQRYSVGLPWKTGYGQIPCNYNNALIRLKGQLKKLSKTPGILQQYEEIIKEHVELGIIERVSETNLNKKVSYLPHQPVVRENAETTKVRIVYDASCKDREAKTSLNDCLHVGPSLTPMIFDVLIRFREQPIVLEGDIEKAFLNIEVHPVDRDCLRFLLVGNVEDQSPEVIEYRFNRVCSGRSLAKMLDEEKEAISKEVVQEEDSKSKILGLPWDKKEDVLEFDLGKVAENAGQADTIPYRIIFDPLGVIRPVESIC